MNTPPREPAEMTDAQRCDLLHDALYALVGSSMQIRERLRRIPELNKIVEDYFHFGREGWEKRIENARIILEETKL